MIRDPWARNRLIRDAFYAALERRMSEDPRVHILGEGAEVKCRFDAPSILERFPGRVLTMPISEDANTNFAVGMALGGLVPVVDVISSDFLYRTMDAICNTAAKLAAVGEARTIVIKAEFMTGGPTTGQRIESLFTHVPGLSVCCPSTPMNAYWSMLQALKHKGVTVVFEDRMIEDAVTPEQYNDYLDGRWEYWSMRGPRACVRQYGNRLTVISYGLTAQMVANWLGVRVPSPPRGPHQTDCTFIDLCWLYPIDWPSILDSVSRTGALLVVEPDVKHAGIGAEIIAHVAEVLPGVKVARLGAPRRTIPSARELHETMLPTREAVLAKCEEMTR